MLRFEHKMPGTLNSGAVLFTIVLLFDWVPSRKYINGNQGFVGKTDLNSHLPVEANEKPYALVVWVAIGL